MTIQNLDTTVPIKDVLAAAVAVYQNQGFVRKGEKYYDVITGYCVVDNRKAVKALLTDYVADKDNIEQIQVTDSDKACAQKIQDYFRTVCTMQKIADNLGDFERRLMTFIDSDVIDTRNQLAMVASLPHSFEMAKIREKMDHFYHRHQNQPNGYVGSVNERIRLDVNVIDAKFIVKSRCFLVTSETVSGSQIVKFFIDQNINSQGQSAWHRDPSDLVGKSISIVGTVQNQKINPHTDCQETKLNRVSFVTLIT